MDGTAQMSSETNWTFGYKTKIKFGSIPENAYLGDVFITSSNESVVSIVDGYLSANSNEGTSRIDIYDRYSLLHTIVNITVKRCITQGGFKLINQNSDALMMSFAGTIQNSKGVEVLGASLVDSSNRVLALADNIGTPSDIVQFSTKIINMTSLFGIYVIHEYDFPKYRYRSVQTNWMVSSYGEKFLLLPFLFPHLHNINKITIFALRRCMKSCITQNLRKDYGRSRI